MEVINNIPTSKDGKVFPFQKSHKEQSLQAKSMSGSKRIPKDQRNRSSEFSKNNLNMVDKNVIHRNSNELWGYNKKGIQGNYFLNLSNNYII